MFCQCKLKLLYFIFHSNSFSHRFFHLSNININDINLVLHADFEIIFIFSCTFVIFGHFQIRLVRLNI